METEEGLTFCWRQRARGRVDKHARMDVEEVRRSKSTGTWKHLRAQGKKWLHHFTKVINVALLSATLFCCNGLAAYRGFFIWLIFHNNFPFLNLYFFNFERKIFFIFCVQLKGDTVCILHSFWLRNNVYSVTLMTKATKKGNTKARSWKETSSGCKTATFVLLHPRAGSHACFIMWILLRILKNVKGSRLELHHKPRVHFYRGAFPLPKIKSKAHSFCHGKGLPFPFLGAVWPTLGSYLPFG